MEVIFKERIAENFRNLGKELDMQAHETSKTSNYLSPKIPSLRHILLKLSKDSDKEKILRAARQKKITYKGIPTRNQQITQQKPYRLGESGMIYSKYWKTKTTSQEVSI